MSGVAAGRLGCPSCHRIDLIQKASAVFAAGTSTTAVVGPLGGRRIAIKSQALRSAILAPPGRPSCRRRPTGRLALLAAASIVSALVLYGALNGSVSTDRTQNLALVLLVCLAPIYLIWQLTDGEASRRRQEERGLAEWEKAMSEWQQLYYCHRCDGVFVPDGSPLKPVDWAIALRYHDAGFSWPEPDR
jgi:hypothetical protein